MTIRETGIVAGIQGIGIYYATGDGVASAVGGSIVGMDVGDMVGDMEGTEESLQKSIMPMSCSQQPQVKSSCWAISTRSS